MSKTHQTIYNKLLKTSKAEKYKPSKKTQSKVALRTVTANSPLPNNLNTHFYQALTQPGQANPAKTLSDWPADLDCRTSIFINQMPIVQTELTPQILNGLIPHPALREFITNYSHQDGYLHHLPTLIWDYFAKMEPPIFLSGRARSNIFLFEVLDKQIHFKLITHHASMQNMANEGEPEACSITFAHQGIIKLLNHQPLIAELSFEYDPQSSLAEQLAVFENHYNTQQPYQTAAPTADTRHPSEQAVFTKANALLKAEFDHYQNRKDYYKISSHTSYTDIVEKFHHHQQLKQKLTFKAKTNLSQKQAHYIDNLHETLANNAKLLSLKLDEKMHNLDDAILAKSQTLEALSNTLYLATNTFQQQFKKQNATQLTKTEQWLSNNKNSGLKKMVLMMANLFKLKTIQRAKLRIQTKTTLIELSKNMSKVAEELMQLQIEQQQLNSYKKELELDYAIFEVLQPLHKLRLANSPLSSKISTDSPINAQISLIKAIQALQQHSNFELKTLFTHIQNFSHLPVTQPQEALITHYWSMSSAQKEQILLTLQNQTHLNKHAHSHTTLARHSLDKENIPPPLSQPHALSETRLNTASNMPLKSIR